MLSEHALHGLELELSPKLACSEELLQLVSSQHGPEQELAVSLILSKLAELFLPCVSKTIQHPNPHPHRITSYNLVTSHWTASRLLLYHLYNQTP